MLIPKGKSLCFKALFTLLENNTILEYLVGTVSMSFLRIFGIMFIHNLGLKYAKIEKEKKKCLRGGDNTHLF